MTADLGETIAFVMIGAVILGSGLASSMVKRTFHSVMFLGVTLVSVASLFILLGSPLIGVIQILVYVGGILTLFVFAVMFVAGDEEETAPVVIAPRSGAWYRLTATACALAALVLALMFAGRVDGAANRFLTGVIGGYWAQLGGLVAGTIFFVVCGIIGLIAWLGAKHMLDTWPGSRLLGLLVATVILSVLLGIATGTAAWSDSATDASQTAANDQDTLVTSLFGAQVVALEVLGVLLTAVMIGSLVIARPLTGVSDKQRYAAITRREVDESQRASDAMHPPTAPPASANAPFEPYGEVGE